ncbi:mitochondrial carrier domain-containing protein [Xylariaceae sp. FL1019]|nr:mitochondrial carrier domain-containing protein [Xylariaceae sp. FL1019]
MASSSSAREGVNPLRPYYIPPTIGEQTRPIPSSASPPSAGRYASKARDIFPDLDYKDHLDDINPSTIQSLKHLVDDLLWKYTSVLMAQPFEVAKTILQARLQDDLGALHADPVRHDTRPDTMSPKNSVYGDAGHHTLNPASEPSTTNPWDASRSRGQDDYPDYSDSDPDEPSYFTSNAPYTPTPSTRSRRRQPSSTPPDPPKANAQGTVPTHQIVLRRPDSILDVISQLWAKESAWGVWKATNATFVYTVLQSLLENWGRSLLSALLNVPDLGVKDDVERLVDIASPYPWASLCVAATAAVATGLILAPFDLIRTRLILTSTSRGSRRTLAALRSLPSWLCHPSLVAPTILNSLIHPFLTLSTPLVLRSQFLIDKDFSPTAFSVAKFCASCVSLFIKLPLETVLRRGQFAVLAEPSHLRALDKAGQMDTVIQPGPYHGVVGTMYTIVSEEGSRAVTVPAKSAQRGRKGKGRTSEVVYKKGQGLEGLWRGWKVSWWGLVGLWTAGIAGAGGEGEF